jgi:PTH1 family peptidyl-tRNA hydrolase
MSSFGDVEFWLIVGLGNPGIKYNGTRHNVGFEALDALVDRLARVNGVSSINWQNKDDAESCVLQIGDRRIVCAKPLSYMNRSGEPVGRLQRFYKVPLSRLIVLHDELDLSLGVVRLKNGGGEAGHNGLRSIAQVLGSREFYRVRLGIGHPRDVVAARESGSGTSDVGNRSLTAGGAVSVSVSSWVLSKFNPDEGERVRGMCEKAADAIELVVKEGFLKAQNSINR